MCLFHYRLVLDFWSHSVMLINFVLLLTCTDAIVILFSLQIGVTASIDVLSVIFLRKQLGLGLISCEHSASQVL